MFVQKMRAYNVDEIDTWQSPRRGREGGLNKQWQEEVKRWDDKSKK